MRSDIGLCSRSARDMFARPAMCLTALYEANDTLAGIVARHDPDESHSSTALVTIATSDEDLTARWAEKF